jgi:hypothetical protein
MFLSFGEAFTDEVLDPDSRLGVLASTDTFDPDPTDDPIRTDLLLQETVIKDNHTDVWLDKKEGETKRKKKSLMLVTPVQMDVIITCCI